MYQKTFSIDNYVVKQLFDITEVFFVVLFIRPSPDEAAQWRESLDRVLNNSCRSRLTLHSCSWYVTISLIYVMIKMSTPIICLLCYPYIIFIFYKILFFFSELYLNKPKTCFPAPYTSYSNKCTFWKAKNTFYRLKSALCELCWTDGDTTKSKGAKSIII